MNAARRLRLLQQVALMEIEEEEEEEEEEICQLLFEQKGTATR